jgi:hypothetical protein
MRLAQMQTRLNAHDLPSRSGPSRAVCGCLRTAQRNRYGALIEMWPDSRLEVLAVEVLTAIGERDAAVWDAERRAGQALRTMTDDEELSVRGRRVVRQRRHDARGDSAAPPCTGHAQRRRLSA